MSKFLSKWRQTPHSCITKIVSLTKINAVSVKILAGLFEGTDTDTMKCLMEIPVFNDDFEEFVAFEIIRICF